MKYLLGLSTEINNRKIKNDKAIATTSRRRTKKKKKRRVKYEIGGNKWEMWEEGRFDIIRMIMSWREKRDIKGKVYLRGRGK